MLFHLEDALKFCQEPLVYARHLPNLINGVSAMKGGRYSEDAFIGGID